MDWQVDFKQRKTEVDKEIRRFYRQKIKQAELIDPFVAEAYRDLLAITLRGGKRGRPILMQLGYELAGGRKRKAIIQASIATELLHKFFLIHDDIIDKDLRRYGGPTLEAVYQQKFLRRFGKKHEAEHSGKAIAIVLGDLSHDFAYEALMRNDFPWQRKLGAMRMMQQTVLETAAGWQMQYEQNLMTISQVPEKAVLKAIDLVTAKYSVAAPLRLGIILANKEKLFGEAMERIGMAIGRAFQIQDDILGLFGDEKVTGKPVGADLREGKKTLLMLMAYKKGNKKQQEIINQALGKGKVSASQLAKIRKVVMETGSLEYSQKMAQSLVDNAKKEIWLIKGEKRVKEILVDLADFMIKREY